MPFAAGNTLKYHTLSPPPHFGRKAVLALLLFLQISSGFVILFLLNTKIQNSSIPRHTSSYRLVIATQFDPNRSSLVRVPFIHLGYRLDHHPHIRHVESTIIAIRSLGTPHIVDLQVHLPQASKTRHTLCTVYSLQFIKGQYLVSLLDIPRWTASSHLGQRSSPLTTPHYELLQSSSSTREGSPSSSAISELLYILILLYNF